ncbi:MAG: glycosyltransferase [Rhodoglobus sp.]
MVRTNSGVVSIVLVNFRGSPDTIVAVENLRTVDWPADRLEVIVVDNDSGDGSADAIRAAAPWVTVIESSANLGFAGGCNLGAASSRGEVVAFLNSDAKPDPAWISAAMAELDADSAVGAVASRVLDWDGVVVDYIDAGLTWLGKGYKPFVGETAGTLGLVAKDVLFGTGSGMFVRRSVFDELGGFDDLFFMFYEDVDLGWRLNLAGGRFRYVPESVVYHRHHGTAGKFGSFKETYLLERNALFALYKNLEQSRLDDVLPAALALTVRRAVAAGKLDSTSLDYRSGADDASLEQTVAREGLAGLFAVDQFVEHLPELHAARERIQSTRRLSDRQLWSLFGRVDALPAPGTTYREAYESVTDAFPVIEEPGRTKVLIITGDPLGQKMAGPAIRAWNMAMALSAVHDVTLVTLTALEQLEAPFALARVRPGDNRAFAPFEAWADIIVFQGHAMEAFDALGHTSKIVVADIYDPMHLEQLEQARELPAGTWDKQVVDATRTLNEQLLKADFFLCASDRQRMFYLGQLSALGRINPANYADDPDLSKLLAVVPFGFDATPPVHERQVLKGVREGIGPDDKVLLWGGGLYNWFDPKTLIRAVAQVASRREGVRLFFQGTRHPHPGVPEMEIVAASRALAGELGVVGKSVFFNDSWVDYSDRQNFLLEADAGVSTHFEHIETTFSFRTRILDYLWAGLPMVVTTGDSFAELVRDEELGFVVEAEDVDGLAVALEAVLFDEALAARFRANVARVRGRFQWDQTLAPLIAFAAAPRHAPDLLENRLAAGLLPEVSAPRRRKAYGFRHNVELVTHYLRNGGVRVVLRKVRSRLRAR